MQEDCFASVLLNELHAGRSVPLQDNEVNNTEVGENIYRLPKEVVPIHYDIRLIPHIVEGNFTFNGEVDIDIEVVKPTNKIALHTEQLMIDELLTRLTRKGNDDVNAAQNYIPKEHEYNNDTQILTIRFEERLDPGTYKLYLKFEGVIMYIHGFYRSFYTDNEGRKVWLAATHFQPISARQAFPCWDEPAIKATFKFSIKHYPNYTALSNMPSALSEVDPVDGKLWTYFETTPIMSTNLLGFVIADYDYVSNLDGTMKIWGPRHLLRHAAYPLDIAEKATRELEKFTNSTVGVPKMDHVAVPHYSSRATENWGMIAYAQHVLLEDETLLSKSMNTMTITHELAHQWFGNLVSPAWWNYLWLSEGTSTYLKYYITDKFIKEWRLMDLFVVQEEQLMLLGDSFHSKPININITNNFNIYYAYSANTYVKSAILLRMISHVLTEDVFRKGLIKYLQAHEYSIATPDDLWKALQDALDESNVPHDDFKVKEVMDTWFNQAAYPVVTIHRDYNTSEIKATQHMRVKFSQSDDIERTDNERNDAWWIPLNYLTQSNLNSLSTLATHWLKPQDESVTIEGVDVDDWIIVNKQLTGYYRVNYDVINWKRIAAFLNSDDYDKIPILNRAQIIDDAYDMLMTEQLDSVTFLEIIKYLSRESDPAPWYPVFRIINQLLLDYLWMPQGAAIFKPYFFNLTHKLCERMGFNDHPNDDLMTTKIRLDFNKIACLYNTHPKCREEATAKLLAYVEDPITNKISSGQEFICFGLIQANESIWNQFLQRGNETSTSHYKFLGCSENFDIIEKHLNFTKETNKYYYLFKNMLENLPNVNTAIDFFIKHFDQIVADQYDRHSLNDIIMMSIEEDHIEKIKAFAEQRGLDISDYLDNRLKKLTKMNDDLAKVRSVLENNQFL
ncbi:aminopeptidase N-like [Cataglyphis hispanica]|uniref:aminopeptidase N-like n=1 Tax=Cataglyphis hispanica TaxID=1086592 RepID=UPI00217FB91B|nr:aminopeptidase N-like [Cataglyphis hispanica]